MTREELAKKIYSASHLNGEFKLRSGQISNEYFDKYLFESDPSMLSEIAKYMKNLVPDETQVLAGLEMGGIPIATMISFETNIKSAFVRKKAKEYGTCKLAEGIDVEGKKVCIIEDVVTTGGQIIASVEELRRKGAIIDTVLCVILRKDEAISMLKSQGLDLKPLFAMDYIKSII